MEIWKDIKGYEGKYQGSNLGNIKSLVYKKPKILKPRLDKDGYLKVILWLLLKEMVIAGILNGKY